MITLNSDRGLERVEDWNDICSLPGFTEKLNPKKHELKEIIGSYSIISKVACGLSDCRKPHIEGYIVTTKAGQITNIGNVCGKNTFGVDFQQQSNVFTRMVTEHNNRESLYLFQSHIEGHIEELKTLLSGNLGANEINKNAKALVTPEKNPSDTIIKEVRKIANTREGSIIIPRVATEEEIEIIEASQKKPLPRPHYVDDKTGYLRGIEIFYPENDLRELLIKDAQTNLRALKILDVDSATYSELQFWSKWCSDFESKISKAKTIIKHGTDLLQSDNLLKLTAFIDNLDEINGFKRWVKENSKP